MLLALAFDDVPDGILLAIIKLCVQTARLQVSRLISALLDQVTQLPATVSSRAPRACFITVRRLLRRSVVVIYSLVACSEIGRTRASLPFAGLELFQRSVIVG